MDGTCYCRRTVFYEQEASSMCAPDGVEVGGRATIFSVELSVMFV